MSAWHFVKNGQKEGPVETLDLQKMIQSGSLPPTTLVWKQGMAEWVAANTLPDFGATAIVAPPLGAEDPADVEKNKVMGIIAYIWLLFIVPILVARESKFAMYHTNQALILFILSIATYFAVGILGALPVVGLVTLLLFPLVGLAHLVLMILGIVNAAQGQMKPLPLIGTLFTLIK